MNDAKRSVQSEVHFREITKDTVRMICELSVFDEQKDFVAPNAISIAEVHFSDRAIYCNASPVSFVMLKDSPEKPEYFLWRFMIDLKYQRPGIGRQTIQILVEHIKTRPNSSELLTSVVRAEVGPKGFYQNLGFVLTGEYEDGEALMRLLL